MTNSANINRAEEDAFNVCRHYRHEYYLPEHLLFGFLRQSEFQNALLLCDGKPDSMQDELNSWLAKQDRVPEGINYQPQPSYQFAEMVNRAFQHVIFADREEADVPHFVQAMLELQDSEAAYVIAKATEGRQADFVAALASFYSLTDDDPSYGGMGDEELDMDDDQDEALPAWRQLVTCVSDQVNRHNPLIGREKELDRTIQVLCRKEKNNPLHVGEPGVGKTSLVYGLAARIEKGEVPERLKSCRIYQMDMGQMLAGTQYRGDFEKRIKMVMDGVRKEGNAIVYLDEIHNIVGAGANTGGGPDASNMLKPYLETGDIRFIGSTTYEEYNRNFARQKSIVRRFQQIDILEPSVDETIGILKGLQKKYEEFHHVIYRPEAIEYAVTASAKYISDRFLPDKAIDLIDEAGAYLELHPSDKKRQYVTVELVRQILQKVCKIDAVAMKEKNNDTLKSLYKQISGKIYGQDEAVRQVTEAVEMAKAGLVEPDKPLASLLFVGPTGVGKTELARVLAHELGVELIRFDMSEYTEKHTVAKLIGSPAGYVGYEDGGLLTDAIRKTPNCVLLLDEIEKAHADIYNILLQVMDYARLTDNKGQKADFRNVVLIMTSNAGAQFASRANIGFSGHVSRGEAMLSQVKKVFKPEFINRLSGTVVFHDMDKKMAGLILQKKLNALQLKLDVKKIKMNLTPEAEEQLLKWGYTAEYGAREMDRVIAQKLKPLFMREILYGKLKNGGSATVIVEKENLKLEI